MKKNSFTKHFKGIILIALFLLAGCTKGKDHLLRVWINQAPYSADPYEFDVSVHHRVYGPTFIKLFSAYKDARLGPSLVNSWTSEDSYKTWKFVLRTDVKFEDGLQVNAQHVANSIKRLIILSGHSKSQNRLLKNIVGVRRMSKVDDQIIGIEANDNVLTLRLQEPDQGLPEVLAFGLFGVVHPSDFDATSGAWKSGVRAKSSGPFKLLNAEKEEILLQLRSDFPADLRSEGAFTQIEYRWARDQRSLADLMDGYASEDLPAKGFEFKGNTNSDISFVQIYSWQDPTSILSKKKNRILLREKFYSELIRNGVKPIRSFIPLIHPGVSEISFTGSLIDSNDFLNTKVVFKPPRNIQVKEFRLIKDAMETSILSLGAKVDAGPEMDTKAMTALTRLNKGERSKIHLALRGTTLGNEDPRETIKFMISQEGITLPDPNGSILKITENRNFSLQEVNKAIMDEAVVWPTVQISRGFWVNTSKVDLSRYNHQWPLSELQWMGAK